MNNNDLKLYSVMVAEGSGCLFQPLVENKEYTYVLTAKHLFEGRRIDDNTGKSEEYAKQENEPVEIKRFLRNNQGWEETLIDFKVQRGVNYFPHREADAAILKVNYIENFDDIFIQNTFGNETDFLLSGSPQNWRHNKEGDRYTSFRVDRFIAAGNNCHSAELAGPLSQNDIEGMSGCGILKIIDDKICIIGTQSKMANDLFPASQIGFVPIEYFSQITAYNENLGKLVKLLPPYFKSFEFLRDKAFNINAGLDDGDISYTRLFLKWKTKEVIDSDITPYYIKEYFKERLLLNEKNLTKLENEIIYITWLEFLTIINIVKSKPQNKGDLEELFSVIRLIYKDTNADWLDDDFLKECLVVDYQGLRDSGTVLIKTNKLPARAKVEHYKIVRGSIVPRVDGLKKNYLKGNLVGTVENISNALSDLKEFAFDRFNFMHFEYLKHFMLIENCSDFKEFSVLNQEKLLEKLKQEYGKIFGL
jgi:hypothetical protein